MQTFDNRKEKYVHFLALFSCFAWRSLQHAAFPGLLYLSEEVLDFKFIWDLLKLALNFALSVPCIVWSLSFVFWPAEEFCLFGLLKNLVLCSLEHLMKLCELHTRSWDFQLLKCVLHHTVSASQQKIACAQFQKYSIIALWRRCWNADVLKFKKFFSLWRPFSDHKMLVH